MDPQLAAGWHIDDPDGRPLPVHLHVARWARERPDATAISCPDGTISYRDLEERANRLAHHLRGLGVARDVVAAIHLDRGLDHYIALLAILKAGGAALPLDITYPAARLRYMLADSGARVVLTRAGLPDVRSEPGAAVVVDMVADAGRIAAYPADPPPGDVAPDDLAYVMYTSASTGPPKGVMLEHGGIANMCRWHIAVLGLTDADRGSLAAPLSFDAAIVDLWPLLIAGGQAVAIADEDRADLPRLVRALADQRVTVCFLTTALAELLLAQPDLDTLSLRYLVTGGEALRRRPRPGLPFELVNIYGPTETTVYVTSTVVEDAATGTGAIPIGHPMGGVGVHLLDKQGEPVPDGEPGEIAVTGPGVARGYLGKPELTAQRFRQDADGGRRYHTGDLARRRPDGRLEYLGRLDRQVKVRGHRIEPDEIERVLLEQPAIRQAAVVAVRPTGDAAQLVAYVQPADEPADPPVLAGLTEAVRNAADGETVVLDRVRALPLREAAYATAVLAAAPAGIDTDELRWRVRGMLLADDEPAVHPAAFTALAGTGRIAAVEVVPRLERSTEPRYDVRVRVGPPRPAPEVHWLDTADLATVRRLLTEGTYPLLGVRAVPNALLHNGFAAWQGEEATAGAVVPADLFAQAIGLPYRTRLSWAAGRSDGSVDVIWVADAVPEPVDLPWPTAESEVLTNDPGRPARDAALRAQLHAALTARLVRHEVPDLLVVLDRLPLTPVGKVDRAALPLPAWLSGAGSADGPRTPAEDAVTALVGDVLGRAGTGRGDDLRALGAHSLAMAQLSARISGRFLVDVPVRELLAEPTIAGIAARLEAAVVADLRRELEVA